MISDDEISLTPMAPENVPVVDPPVNTDPPTETPTEPSTDPPTMSKIPEKLGFDRENTTEEVVGNFMSTFIDQELFVALNDIAVEAVAEVTAATTVSSPTVSNFSYSGSIKTFKTFSNLNSWSCEICDPEPSKYRCNQRGGTHFRSKKHAGTERVIEFTFCPKCGPGEEEILSEDAYSKKTIPRWKKKVEKKCCDSTLKMRVKPFKE